MPAVAAEDSATVGGRPGAVRRAVRAHPLAVYVVRRIVTGAGLAVVVSFLVFGGTQILPGNAPSSILGDKATPQPLALIALVLIIPVSFVIGVITGLRAGGAIDHVFSVYSLVNIAMPEFVIGTL